MKVSLSLVLASLILFTLASSASASPAVTTFERRWHWFLGAQGHTVEQLPDGSYIICGETRVDSLTYGIVLIRADSLGDTIWVRHIKGVDERSGYSCCLPDGGIAVLGTVNRGKIFVTKFSALGESAWTYTSTARGLVSAILATSDGGCVVTGRFPNPNFDFGLLKLDVNGQQEWLCNYDEPRVAQTMAQDVAPTQDGGYILCGDGSDYSGIYVRMVRTNAQGETIWARLYTDAVGPSLSSVQQTPGGDFLAVGHEFDTLAGGYALYLMRASSTGEVTMRRNAAPYAGEGHASAFCPASNGGYMVAGTADWGDSAHVWLVRLDDDANILWDRALPGALVEEAADICPTSDGGFAVVGRSDAHDGSLLFLKTDSLGGQGASIVESDQPSLRSLLSLQPNPARDRVQVLWSRPKYNTIYEIGLYDASGQRVETWFLSKASSTYSPTGYAALELDVARFPRGIYLLSLRSGAAHSTRKLVLQ